MTTTGCNEQNCTCPKTDCPRHGKCCECVNYHRTVNTLVVCMRTIGAATPAKAEKSA